MVNFGTKLAGDSSFIAPTGLDPIGLLANRQEAQRGITLTQASKIRDL